jgi:predicted DNA-binding ArsR family transcriptional regulator
MVAEIENDLELYVENRPLTTFEEDLLLNHIEAYKAKKYNNAITRLLQNGKLTVDEISDCLEISKIYILQIQQRLIAA